MTNELDLKRLAELIKEIKVAMLTTVSDDGSMHSRPMGTQELNVDKFDGILWFFSNKNSHKNQSIKNDQHVTLAYANPAKQHFISISGRANISEDKGLMKELWNPFLKAWFPEGLNDPNLSLIGVDITSAEIWDKQLSKAEQMMRVVRSAITGKSAAKDLSSHKIDFDHQKGDQVPYRAEDSGLMSDDEKVDEALKESFPASDAPAHFRKSETDLSYEQ